MAPRSEDDSSSNAEMGEELLDALENIKQLSEPGCWEYYLPCDAQSRVITQQRVFQFLKDLTNDNQKLQLYTRLILERATKLFATLILMKKGDEICKLLSEGVTDADLPLQRGHNDEDAQKLCFTRKDGTLIKAMLKWKTKELRKFGGQQFEAIAPVLRIYRNMGRFPDGTIMPFKSIDSGPEEGEETDKGGYSEVFKRELHPEHHDFAPKGSRVFVAIKRLNSTETSEFEKETEILWKLGKKPHPHLVKLWTTYTLKKRPHLVFPWADANLRQYWARISTPTFSREVLLWSISQMKGIAEALSLIHDYNTTVPLSGTFSSRDPNHFLAVHDHEKAYGRHGDIKPENFLWFSDENGGVLQIADFGLGRFHGRDSRSKVSSTYAQATPTYEPPECQLHIQVSRKYDIWSLGCVLLEYITWLILGHAALEDFAEARSKKDKLGIDEDKFYRVLEVNGKPQAIVEPGVEKWVSKLQSNRKCSHMIHDLLELVRVQMLVVDQAKRLNSQQLNVELVAILHKARADDKYLERPHSLSAEDLSRLRLDSPSPARSSNTWPVPVQRFQSVHF